MSTDILEIYLNSRTATQYYNNLISDAMFTLPVIEINKNEKAYICVKNAVFLCSLRRIRFRAQYSVLLKKTRSRSKNPMFDRFHSFFLLA